MNNTISKGIDMGEILKKPHFGSRTVNMTPGFAPALRQLPFRIRWRQFIECRHLINISNGRTFPKNAV
jgi:hypothetical protein